MVYLWFSTRVRMACYQGENTMAKNTHLTLDERATIEISLKEGASFTKIGRTLGKDPSTISKEVKNHNQVVRKGSYNPCAKRTNCSHMGKACNPCKHPYHGSCKGCSYRNCYEYCPDFVELICQKLRKPSYVCNGCDTRMRCKLERHLYDAKNAQKEYEATRSESRQGIAITPSELKRIDRIISPLVNQGQSIHMICVNNADDIMLDEKTIYNYIDAGLLSVDNIDLPRKVRYRTRSHKKLVRVDKQCHAGRTYEDFETYLAANPDIPVVEMDSVEGRKGGKVLLTIYFCDPQRSDQKGGCEVTHEMIRRVLPKGTSFDELVQDDIDLMMSNINSYNRKKLNNQSAYQLFSFLNSVETLNKLNIKLIPANEINLTPLLLKK